MVSLRKLAGDRILSDMLGIVDQQEGARNVWKVLVLDSWTREVVDSACSLTDLVTCGVVAVRMLGALPDPLVASLPTVYFTFPCSADAICKESPQRVYAFFTSALDAAAHTAFTTHPAISPGLKGCHTLMMSVKTTEHRVFECPVPRPFRSVYHPQAQHAVLMAHLKTQLACVADLLGVSPEVRYFRTGSLGAAFAKELARETAKEVYRPPKVDKTCHAVLVIVDRSVDLVAPLLHDLTVQAMAHDFLPLGTNGTIALRRGDGAAASGEPRQKILRETNRMSSDLWKSVRHAHITDALAYLEAQKETLKQSTKHQEREFEELGVYSETVKVLPAYKQRLIELCTMIDLMHSIERSFHASHMYRIVLLEQTLATLRDAKNMSVSMDLAIRTLRSLMGDETVQVDSSVMMRLITLLLVQFPGVPIDHQKALMQVAGLTEAQQNTIERVSVLGVQLSLQTSTVPIAMPDPSLFEGTVKVATLPKAMCRYVHRIRGLALAALQGQLEERTAPYVTPTTFSQQWRLQKLNKNNNAKGGSSPKTGESPPMLILFVIGGVTHGEISCVYDTCSTYHCEVFLGSTGAITSSSFMKHLSEL